MKRIFNILGYVLFLTLFVYLFFVFQSYTVLYIDVFLVLFPIISVLLGRYAVNRLDIKVTGIKEAINSNEEFVITFTIKNPTWIPIVDANIMCSYFNNFFECSENLILSVPIYSHGTQVVKLPVKSDYCGIVDVNISQVNVWDMLHVWHAACKVNICNSIVLYPHVNHGIEIDPNIYVCGSDDSEETHKKGNDFSDISDVREYIPGDSLKDIHWKLSVKKEALMVKEHVTMSSKQIAILIELFEDGSYVIDSIMKLSYSVCYNLASSNMPFTIYWWSENSKQIKEKIILNVEDVNICFRELFYEKTYKEVDKAYYEFSNIENYIESIICITNHKINENEDMIINFERGYLTYREVI